MLQSENTPLRNITYEVENAPHQRHIRNNSQKSNYSTDNGHNKKSSRPLESLNWRSDQKTNQASTIPQKSYRQSGTTALYPKLFYQNNQNQKQGYTKQNYRNQRYVDHTNQGYRDQENQGYHNQAHRGYDAQHAVPQHDQQQLNHTGIHSFTEYPPLSSSSASPRQVLDRGPWSKSHLLQTHHQPQHQPAKQSPEILVTPPNSPPQTEPSSVASSKNSDTCVTPLHPSKQDQSHLVVPEKQATPGKKTRTRVKHFQPPPKMKELDSVIDKTVVFMTKYDSEIEAKAPNFEHKEEGHASVSKDITPRIEVAREDVITTKDKIPETDLRQEETNAAKAQISETEKSALIKEKIQQTMAKHMEEAFLKEMFKYEPEKFISYPGMAKPDDLESAYYDIMEVAVRLNDMLKTAGRKYVFVGSVGLFFHGQMRITNNVDILIEKNSDSPQIGKELQAKFCSIENPNDKKEKIIYTVYSGRKFTLNFRRELYQGYTYNDAVFYKSIDHESGGIPVLAVDHELGMKIHRFLSRNVNVPGDRIRQVLDSKDICFLINHMHKKVLAVRDGCPTVLNVSLETMYEFFFDLAEKASPEVAARFIEIGGHKWMKPHGEETDTDMCYLLRGIKEYLAKDVKSEEEWLQTKERKPNIHCWTSMLLLERKHQNRKEHRSILGNLLSLET